MIEFFNKSSKWIEENPDSDESDLKEFIQKTRPNYRRGDREALHSEMIEDAAVKKAREEGRKELDEIRKEQRRQRQEPEAWGLLRQFNDRAMGMTELNLGNGIMAPVISKECIKAFGDNPEARPHVADEFPFEGELWLSAWSAFKAFLFLTSDLEDFDENNPTHTFILKFLRDQEAALPNDKRIRNGRRFLTRVEYGELPKDQRQNYWRFELDDIGKLLIMKAQIKLHGSYSRIRKSGFVREVAPITDNPPTPIEDNPPAESPKGPSPKVGSSPATPAVPVAPAKPSPLMENIYNRLGRK